MDERDRVGREGDLRTADQIRADQTEAEQFWQRAASPDSEWRAQVATEGDPLALALREAAAWSAKWTATDNVRRAASAARKQSEATRWRRDESQLRHYLEAGTSELLPPTRLHPRTTAEISADRATASAWRDRIQKPSNLLRRRLERERDSHTMPKNWQPRARDWARASAEQQVRSPLEIARAVRLETLQRHTYVRGRITPVGMSYQRALEIACAALAKQQSAGDTHGTPGENDRKYAIGL